jgi:hypothetical protein
MRIGNNTNLHTVNLREHKRWPPANPALFQSKIICHNDNLPDFMLLPAIIKIEGMICAGQQNGIDRFYFLIFTM